MADKVMYGRWGPIIPGGIFAGMVSLDKKFGGHIDQCKDERIFLILFLSSFVQPCVLNFYLGEFLTFGCRRISHASRKTAYRKNLDAPDVQFYQE